MKNFLVFPDSSSPIPPLRADKEVDKGSVSLYNSIMNAHKITDRALKIMAVVLAVTAFLLTFTVSDYYIFNRFAEFGFFFCVSQWIKKGGLLLILLAVFYNKKGCADAVKYALPLFVILSCCLFGNFFDVTKIADTPEQEIYNSVNLFFPKWLNITLFFLQNALYIAVCALFFIRDGFKIKARAAAYIAAAIVLVTPLNIFENFFDIDKIPAESFLRFRNFTVWHFAAVILLAAVAIAGYYLVKKKDENTRDAYLAAIAIALLIQYHSKDSVILGDGYNVYHTLFSCVPLFICNIGMYTASLSVFLKRKTLYSISFFIHAAGALTVFMYFGKDDLSNFGIFCSYSFLYFTFTHVALFALCVLPSALGMYRFRFRDCVVPLIYYFAVIILASVCSALVTSASASWHTADGQYLPESGLLMPNYAFTQINPLPFEVPPVLTVTIWKYQINVLYVLGLYAVYVAIFFTFTGFYYAFLGIRKKVLKRNIFAEQPQIYDLPSGETAATESDEDDQPD